MGVEMETKEIERYFTEEPLSTYLIMCQEILDILDGYYCTKSDSLEVLNLVNFRLDHRKVKIDLENMSLGELNRKQMEKAKQVREERKSK